LLGIIQTNSLAVKQIPKKNLLYGAAYTTKNIYDIHNGTKLIIFDRL